MHKRIISGIQPSGRLTLGNYLGAIVNWVDLQHQFECLFCIVDLHAITVPQDPVALRQSTFELAATYLAAGIDVEKHAIFVQSHVPSHTQLAWILGCMTPVGWLNRMTQFKEKASKNQSNASLGLYAYPVLMAADILLYNATHVPVGDDQKQHLELARDIAQSFNMRYNQQLLTLPEPMIFGETTRVMSLRDGSKKMSKSDESDFSRINLDDLPEDIDLKIRKAKTDASALPLTKDGFQNRPEAQNLVKIYAALTQQNVDSALQHLNGINFSAFKPILTDKIIQTLRPIQKQKQIYLKDPGELMRILRRGAEYANAIAEQTMKSLSECVGFLQI